MINYDNLDDFEWLFLDYCKNNNLEGIKRIEQYTEFYIYKQGFEKACKYNNLEIAKWLLILEKKHGINYNKTTVFYGVCVSGNLEVAKWLMTLDDKPDIHANNEILFITACIFGKLDIIKWLLSLEDKPDIHIMNDYAFKAICNIAQYGLKIYIKVIEYFLTLCYDYHVIIEDGKIKSWKVQNELQFLLENKDYDKIIEKLKIPIKAIKISEDNKCSICYENNYNFLTSCNHTFCVECFMIWYIEHNKKECSFCKQKIEIEKCYVIQN
jgi:hypothetical protein